MYAFKVEIPGFRPLLVWESLKGKMARKNGIAPNAHVLRNEINSGKNRRAKQLET